MDNLELSGHPSDHSWDIGGGGTVQKAAGASADTLLKETIAALDVCLATLVQIDERARVMSHEAEAAHRLMQQHLHDFGLASVSAGSVQTPARVSLGPYSVDHEAIYQDELVMQQAEARLRSLQVKVDYLANLMRLGKAQALGSDSEGLAAAPWASAVRAARIESQEQERIRLAREVHDGPAQVLANTILGLDYCELIASRSPAELGPELKRLRSAMREGLVEVRRFMFDLRPSTLATMGLNATLGRSIEDFQQAFGLPVALDLPAEDLAIDDLVQIVIFRVVQESLQNVQRHAGATAVRVELVARPDGGIRLQIVDNGHGFDRGQLEPALPSGVGLLGMEERAVLVGGQLVIDSAPSLGTTITLYVPAVSPEVNGGADAPAATSTPKPTGPCGGNGSATPADQASDHGSLGLFRFAPPNSSDDDQPGAVTRMVE